VSSPPTFIKPCIPTEASAPPSGRAWVHEIKHDGIRVQALVASQKATLFTRTGLNWTPRLGAVVDDLAALKVQSALIDGEAIVQNERGIADFHLLQLEMRKGRRARIAVMAFDLLNLNGLDLRPQPLLERKGLLRDTLGQRAKSSLLQVSDHVEGDGRAVLASACKLGLEGIVSKRVDKPYRSGRSADWLKALCVHTDQFVVVGYTLAKGMQESIGSLVLGYLDGQDLVHAGRVGTGLSQAEANAVWTALQAIHIEHPDMSPRLPRDQTKDVVWVKPVLVVQVKYRGWTADGLLRHSAFVRFRHYVRPSEARRPVSLRG
jgi:bifunctional non-homologous end joining protein LigD